MLDGKMYYHTPLDKKTKDKYLINPSNLLVFPHKKIYFPLVYQLIIILHFHTFNIIKQYNI
jgi:hypothetical protein